MSPIGNWSTRRLLGYRTGKCALFLTMDSSSWCGEAGDGHECRSSERRVKSSAGCQLLNHAGGAVRDLVAGGATASWYAPSPNSTDR